MKNDDVRLSRRRGSKSNRAGTEADLRLDAGVVSLGVAHFLLHLLTEVRELALPQNDPDLPYPQGRDGVYVRFSNHVTSECPPRLFFSLRPGPNVCAQSWGGATMCRR